MSSEFAIRTEGLGKLYPIGARPRYRSIRDRLAHPFRRDPQVDHAWALDDVSIEVPRGRAVGLVGSNGAGKSTLLRVLARITEPTRGRAVLHGKVASLLEVGAGFHSELTGRENVFLNGSILGMRRADVAGKLDSIVEFAEIGRALDAPVKSYSSGMYLRLAFAVAAHLDADILLVDEVLAVGDARFQRKCLARMSEVLRDGRTVLLVSHATELVRRLCHEAIWLDRGRVVDHGPTNRVVDRYLTETLSRGASIRFDPPEKLHPRGSLCVHSAELRGRREVSQARFESAEEVSVVLRFEPGDARERIGIIVHTADGEALFSSFAEAGERRDAGIATVRCSFAASVLEVGEYSVEVATVLVADPSDVARAHESIAFAVVPSDASDASRSRFGAVRVETSWRVETLEQP